MKILVIDDSRIHQNAAHEQLKDHDLTVVKTYDEAHRLIVGSDRDGHGHHEKHDFDVVLVDLLMPASLTKLSHSFKWVDQVMPVGIFLALLAAKFGAKYVGLLTDTHHHDHPAAACLDAFNEAESRPTPFIVGETKVILSNNGRWNDNGCGSGKKWDKLLEYLLADNPA